MYLAVWLDRCSRKIVGWDVRDTMPEDLVSDEPGRALAVRRPPAGLVGHSDQGSQYTATRFKDLVAKHGAKHEPARQLLRQRPTGYDPRRIVLEPLQSRAARRR